MLRSERMVRYSRIVVELRNNNSRTRLLGALVLLVALILVGRLALVQIVRGEEYEDLALRQYSYVPGSTYERGDVYFRSSVGEKSAAATMKSGFIVAISPGKLENEEETYEKLASVLAIDRTLFFEKVKKTDDPYEEIATRVPQEIADKINDLKITGVSVSEESWRYYPGETLASQVLGFVGFDGDKRVGRYGIERMFEDVLNRGEENLYQNFFAEIFTDVKSSIFDPNETRDGDITLTIEPQVQGLLERVLLETKDKWHASRAAGIVIDPTTGEIFGMAANPSFDANNYSEEDDISVYKNPLVENIYEMGSTFKPLTIASALDAGAITPETTYNDKGFIELNGKKISNYDHRGRGVVAMQEILNQSLNTGTVFAMQKMGREAFHNYMYAFGIPDTTGIDLPAEATGLTDTLNGKEEVEYATASFGQGIAITPITMVRALSALANGGVLVKPHVVDSVDYELGGEERRVAVEQGRAIKEATSEEITRMLVRVVDEALAGGKLKHEHYSIAAKTGTAQVVNPATHEYYDDRFMHTFFGYFPAYEPRFLVFLLLDDPKEVNFASQTLTDSFGEIADFLLRYYNVPPDR